MELVALFAPRVGFSKENDGILGKETGEMTG